MPLTEQARAEQIVNYLSKRLPPGVSVEQQTDDIRDAAGKLLWAIGKDVLIRFTWQHPTSGPLLVVVPAHGRGPTALLLDATEAAMIVCRDYRADWPKDWPTETASRYRKRTA